MNLTAKQLKKVALKLGYEIKEGKKHLLIHSDSGLVSTIPRGRIKAGALAAILKQMEISRDDLKNLLYIKRAEGCLNTFQRTSVG